MDPKPKNYAPLIGIIVIVLLVGVAYIYRGEQPLGKPASLTTNSSAASSPLDNVKPVTSADHLQGNVNAPIVLVEFSDLECPFCKAFHQTLKQVLPDYLKTGQVALVFRHFPLDSLHTKARKEAEATECAAELGGNDAFWKYVDGIFAITPSNDGLDPKELPKIAKVIGLDQKQFEACLASGKYADKVAAEQAEAVASGGQGTPFTVIVTQNKKKLDLAKFDGYIEVSPDNTKITLGGALPANVVKDLLDEIIKQSGN